MTALNPIPALAVQGLPEGETPRPRAGRRRLLESLTGYLFIGPAAILFLAFVLGPFVAAMVLALFDWDLLTPPTFSGLDNLVRLAQDGQFWRSLGNTFLFAFASIVTHLVAGMALALGVNALTSRIASAFVRGALFFPFLISWAAVALLWKFVLDPTFGILAYYLGLIGLTSPNWFSDPAWALPGIILIDFWHTIGYTFLILLAGLQTVPRELMEAARTDGANAWRVFWHVTLPMMSPTLFFATVITFIGAFQIFDPIQIITKGGPSDSTLTAVMYLYRIGFQSFQVGYASMIALAIFVVIMAVTIVQFAVSRKWVHSR